MNPSRRLFGSALCLALLCGRVYADPPEKPASPAQGQAQNAPPRTPSLTIQDDPAENFNKAAAFVLKAVPSKTRRKIEETQTALGRAKSPNNKRAVLRKSLPEIIDDLLSDDEMREVPPKTRNQIDNRFAGVLNQIGDNTAAASVSNDVLKRDPEDREALNNLAVSHFGMRDYAAAIADATRVVRLDPNDETAYTTRALAHYEGGEYLQAIEDARHALALDKNNEAAFATLRLAEGRVVPSRLALNEEQQTQALAIREEYRAKLQQETQVETAIRDSPAPVSPRPETPLLRQTAEKTARGDSRSAVLAATQALAINPRSAQAYYLRAVAYNVAGDYSRTIQDASFALSLDPVHVSALDARSAAFNRLGRWAEALQDCLRSAAARPDNSYAYANCAKAHEGLKDSRAALYDYKNAAALDPQFDSAYRAALAAFRRDARQMTPAPLPQMPPAEPAEPSRGMFHGLNGILVLAAVGGLLILIGSWHALSFPFRRAAPETATPGLASGLRLENYRILKTLGEGGMGVVYEALDEALGRIVAIKKMRDEIKLDPPERARFLAEARTVAALRHPCIVEIHTILEHGSDLYLVFEHVPGKTLIDLINEKKFLTEDEALSVVRGVCAGLEHAHKQNIIHRDLKPSNIMLTDEGRVKVMDFGIASRDAAGTAPADPSETIFGTPPYMAPEIAAGVARPESDVYALGACLYEMLTGQSAVSPRRRLRPALDQLLIDAMQTDPEKRIRTPAEFLARFETIA